MAIQLRYQVLNNNRKLSLIIIASIITLTLVNILLDFLDTLYQHSSFYISESLLFSSYWFLYLPLLHYSVVIGEKKKKFNFYLLLTGLSILVHLFFYPAIVWLISKVFFSHAFNYWQTLIFGLSAYAIKTIIIYSFSFLIFFIYTNKIQIAASVINHKNLNVNNTFISTIIVSEGNNKKTLLDVNEIFYFSANSPYINIHHSSKNFLHSQTLRSLETQLDDKLFVRIHKSYIVNIKKIAYIKSRQNGDYDVVLLNDTFLRASRKYVKNFKLKLTQ